MSTSELTVSAESGALVAGRSTAGGGPVAPQGHAYAEAKGLRLPVVARLREEASTRLRWVSFVLVFCIPFLCCATYFCFIASDQYVSELRFGLRSADPVKVDFGGLGMVAGLSSSNQHSLDSYAIVQYLDSPQLVKGIDDKLSIRKKFSDPNIDPLSRLSRDSNDETLIEYWKSRIDANYDSLNGTVLVRVRAFSPDDAFALAQMIEAKSEELVNGLSAQARHDAVSFAEAEVAKAETRFAKAQADLRTLRDSEGLLDPRKAAEATLVQIAKAREQIVKNDADLRTLRSYMNDAAPTIVNLTRQKASYEHELQALESTLTKDGSTGDPLSKTMGNFESKEIEQGFAERYLSSALEGLQRAQVAADRQQTYLAPFVKPNLPTSSTYPHRLRSTVLSGLAALLTWILLLLAFYSIRDHA